MNSTPKKENIISYQLAKDEGLNFDRAYLTEKDVCKNSTDVMVNPVTIETKKFNVCVPIDFSVCMKPKNKRAFRGASFEDGVVECKYHKKYLNKKEIETIHNSHVDPCVLMDQNTTEVLDIHECFDREYLKEFKLLKPHFKEVQEEKWWKPCAAPLTEQDSIKIRAIVNNLPNELSPYVQKYVNTNYVIQPAVTQPPVTQRPVTQPPVTQRPVTQRPVTQQPVTRIPTPDIRVGLPEWILVLLFIIALILLAVYKNKMC